MHHLDLAKRIASKLKAPYIKTGKKVFPDGESKITINQIPKKSIVIVVQSTYPPVDTNLLELLSIVSKSSKIFLKDICRNSIHGICKTR